LHFLIKELKFLKPKARAPEKNKENHESIKKNRL
jgi:hypothetical protein